MFRRNARFGQVVLWLAVLSPLLSGCGPHLPDQAPVPAKDKILKFASICTAYTASHRKKPSSIEELKAWAKSLKKSELEGYGIDDLATAFVSPRDHQPFVIVNSKRSGPGDVLAYEKTGEGGKHYIVTPMGSVLEVDEATLQQRLTQAK
jgi:hypothetical protein